MTPTTNQQRSFRTRVFIATSLDGYIARPDGDIQWLVRRAADAGDTGYESFMAETDALVMGRNTYEMALTFDAWPYEGRSVAVLSTRLETTDPNITVYPGLRELVQGLTATGATSVYVDGGKVIQSFLREGLLDELTLTTAPVLLGQGIPLFGALDGDIDLSLKQTRALGAGFVQTTYAIGYSLQA
jgi:dihydrofolate reductase